MLKMSFQHTQEVDNIAIFTMRIANEIADFMSKEPVNLVIERYLALLSDLLSSEISESQHPFIHTHLLAAKNQIQGIYFLLTALQQANRLKGEIQQLEIKDTVDYLNRSIKNLARKKTDQKLYEDLFMQFAWMSLSGYRLPEYIDLKLPRITPVYFLGWVSGLYLILSRLSRNTGGKNHE